MFVLPLLLVTVASTYTSDYHELTTNLWSQIPDTLPTGNTVPKGCTCELPANPCLNFDCDCLCDLTAGACDANCCCDTECSQEELIFSETTIRVLMRRLRREPRLSVFPTTILRVSISSHERGELIEKSMLCCCGQQSSDGSFYKDPGTLTTDLFTVTSHPVRVLITGERSGLATIHFLSEQQVSSR